MTPCSNRRSHQNTAPAAPAHAGMAKWPASFCALALNRRTSSGPRLAHRDLLYLNCRGSDQWNYTAVCVPRQIPSRDGLSGVAHKAAPGHYAWPPLQTAQLFLGLRSSKPHHIYGSAVRGLITSALRLLRAPILCVGGGSGEPKYPPPLDQQSFMEAVMPKIDLTGQLRLLVALKPTELIPGFYPLVLRM
jgi:hypothetical protein